MPIPRAEPVSLDQLMEKIDVAIAGQRGEDAIAQLRCTTLEHLRIAIATKGLALTKAEKADYCLLPLIFQELLYDGYTWTNRIGSLGHLEEMVEIDAVVWSGGFQRSQLTDLEYQACHRFGEEVISQRKRISRIEISKPSFLKFEVVAMFILIVGLAGICVYTGEFGGDRTSFYVIIPLAAIALLFAVYRLRSSPDP